MSKNIGDGTNTVILKRRIGLHSYMNQDCQIVFWEESEEFQIDDFINNPSGILSFRDGIALGGNQNLILFSLKEGESYSVTAWSADGTSLLTIDQEIEPVLKSEQEIADEKQFVEGSMLQRGIRPFDFTPEVYRNAIVSVNIGTDGNIWVQKGTELYPTFDVYSPTGTLIERKVFPLPGFSWQFSFGDEGILAWENDPNAGYQKLYLVE